MLSRRWEGGRLSRYDWRVEKRALARWSLSVAPLALSAVLSRTSSTGASSARTRAWRATRFLRLTWRGPRRNSMWGGDAKKGARSRPSCSHSMRDSASSSVCASTRWYWRRIVSRNFLVEICARRVRQGPLGPAAGSHLFAELHHALCARARQVGQAMESLCILVCLAGVNDCRRGRVRVENRSGILRANSPCPSSLLARPT